MDTTKNKTTDDLFYYFCDTKQQIERAGNNIYNYHFLHTDSGTISELLDIHRDFICTYECGLSDFALRLLQIKAVIHIHGSYWMLRCPDEVNETDNGK